MTSQEISRRQFLKYAPLTAALGAAIPAKSFAAASIDAPDFCMVLADHWSYTGIGWSSGLKSCAQSITDCMDMADYAPSVKTCINLDARAYELVAQSYPDVIKRFKAHLAGGKVEIIGGSYGQPMGSMCSGESNLRQLVVGQQTIQKSLGVLVTSFLEEEEFTHPQLPQLLKAAGYQFASTAQCNTWGMHGSPRLDRNAFLWCSPDGTLIPATPLNALVFHPPAVTHDIEWLWSDEGRKAISKLQPLGVPLAIKWVEFGWGPHELEGLTPNKFYAAKFRQLSDHFKVRYTTLAEYLAIYGHEAHDRISWRMDDFHKLEPWGVGGDQLRRKERETEVALLVAERFDAIASALGLGADHSVELSEAWKHLLIAQSHDVSLCEDWSDRSHTAAKDWLSDPFVKTFIATTGTGDENKEVLTWGALGFRHLKVGSARARTTREAALSAIAGAVDTSTGGQGETAAIVFNSTSSSFDGVVSTGPLPQIVGAGTAVVVRDAQGNSLASQALTSETAGSAGSTEVIFPARRLPSLGYATYYVERTNSATPPPASDLQTSESGFHIENALLSVDLDGNTGAITRLMDRRTGADLIDGKRAGFPVFKGRPNQAHPAAQGAPKEFDSSQMKASITWVERGPVRATVRVLHQWPKLQFEYWVTLLVGQPYVDVRVRLRADVPPPPGEGKINGWQFPLEIVEGYWLSLAPAFNIDTVIRDYPFGVEPCAKDAIDGLNFIDLVGADRALLIVHGGTQYFKRSTDDTFSNLLLREWNSHFNPGQYGWPRDAEYRYRLLPHGQGSTNTDRLLAVEAFDQRPVCVLEPLHSGRLPAQQSFVSQSGAGIAISSFRAVDNGAYELRVVEQNGAAATAQLAINLPIARFAPCDSLGSISGNYQPVDSAGIKIKLGPWQIKTFRLERS